MHLGAYHFQRDRENSIILYKSVLDPIIMVVVDVYVQNVLDLCERLNYS